MEIFDLSKIKKLVEENQPNCIVVVDTCFLMNEPVFTDWKTDTGNTLWVLSSAVMVEIEHKRKDRRIDTANKAKKVLENIIRLYPQGSIADGIQIENGQWCISVPETPKHIIEKALSDFPLIFNAYGRVDTELLLMAKQIASLILDIPVIVSTADKGFYSILSSNNVNAILFAEQDNFPLKVIGKFREESLLGAIDWDLVLDGIQHQIKTILAELTLISERRITKQIFDKASREEESIILAEGSGVIHGKTEIQFKWTVPFSQIYYKIDHGGAEWAHDVPVSPELDFGDRINDVTESTVEFVSNLLDDIVFSPTFNDFEAPVTLQDPSSITKQLLTQHFDAEELASIVKQSQNNDERLFEIALSILLVRLGDSKFLEITDTLLRANHCQWKIGQTIKFDVPVL